MVNHISLRLAWALIAAASVSSLAAREYKLGDKAEENITTPAELVVVDTAATEALKEKESQRIPVIYRFNSHAIDEVEAAFHSTFVRTRSNFMEAVQLRFRTPRLSDEETDATEFQRFLTQFQKQNILFPVGSQLGRIWASGKSDQEIESALIARLREAMKAYVRPDSASEDVWVGSTLRIVSLADNETATAPLVAERGFNLAKTNFISVPRSKADLLNSFPAEQRSVAKYLASFIKPNCMMEADLTRELRAQRTAGLLVTDRYPAGQVIVRRGQVINEKTLAALEQLKEKTAATRLRKPNVAPADPMENKFPLTIWLGRGAAAAILILLAALWKSARRRAHTTLSPMPISIGAIATSSTETSLSDESWKQRALLAEQRAAKAQAVVRSGLLGHLAQWMADKLTQKLLSQRAQLLSAQERATLEVAELEARLEKVHAPLQERLLAYERRIADLEKELAAKGEENRELIKAKIQFIRKQLEIEREKNRLDFN